MPASEPRGPFARFAEAYAALLRGLLGVSVAIIIIPVSLQIFSRFTAVIPHYIWTEELARFLLVWMVMLGAILGVREGTHFVVDVFPRLSPRREAMVRFGVGLATLALGFVFLWWGWEFTEGAIYRISELAELPLWLIHMAWPIAGASFLLFTLLHMAECVRVLRA
jgi:TRAP-type C4-dicarboxylate transport system permease small subunit